MDVFILMKKKGFTLIELLIVIAIVGVLVAISLPSYQGYVGKANRLDMQLAMTEMALVAERQYARQNSYPIDASATGITSPDSYDVSLTQVEDMVGFTITATPVVGSSQAFDQCGTMTVNQAGTRTVSDSTVEECW